VTGADRPAVPGSRPDDEQRVRARLTRLARAVPPADAAGTTDRVLAVDRHRRLRALRWAAAAVAVLVLGTAATLARPADVDAVALPVTDRPGPPPLALYDSPPRGSLADDPDFLAGVAALPWSPPPSGSGFTRSFDPGTPRVVYAADVPGGHRWAVVVASYEQQWLVDWFTGPAGAEPGELIEATAPTTFPPGEPVALLDVSAEIGPLVVLADPGVTAAWSATLDRGPDGGLQRSFDPLRDVAGVPAALVRTPVTDDPLRGGELRVTRDGVESDALTLLTTGVPPWARAELGLDRPDPADVAGCLTANGFTVEAAPPSAGFYYLDPQAGDATSDEQAERDRLSKGCFSGTGIGQD
jgi:hypothetical protein